MFHVGTRKQEETLNELSVINHVCNIDVVDVIKINLYRSPSSLQLYDTDQ